MKAEITLPESELREVLKEAHLQGQIDDKPAC